MDNLYKGLYKAIQANKRAEMITEFTGEAGSIAEDMRKRIFEDSESNAYKFKPLLEILENKITFYEPIAAKERLIILGAGHIAVPLCEFAARVGFNVTVVDDRGDFANKMRFPLAEVIICDTFSRAIEKIKVGERDYVTIVTRGHRYDTDCLRNILESVFPHYLGMIGSKRRVKGVMELLAEEGFEEEILNQICTPIGLDIGGITPAEISISILAEIILYKRKKGKNASKTAVFTDLDVDVIRYLAKIKEPSATITVIDTKGSTPRGVGAKMVVNRIGQTFGTIGGGCAEKEVINKAISTIGTGRYQVYKNDMTGDVAEEEGMACGGVMDILIEDNVFI